MRFLFIIFLSYFYWYLKNYGHKHGDATSLLIPLTAPIIFYWRVLPSPCAYTQLASSGHHRPWTLNPGLLTTASFIMLCAARLALCWTSHCPCLHAELRIALLFQDWFVNLLSLCLGEETSSVPGTEPCSSCPLCRTDADNNFLPKRHLTVTAWVFAFVRVTIQVLSLVQCACEGPRLLLQLCFKSVLTVKLSSV